jgi:hypothetical protein
MDSASDCTTIQEIIKMYSAIKNVQCDQEELENLPNNYATHKS